MDDPVAASRAVLDDAIAGARAGARTADGPPPERARDLFRDQVVSRTLDEAARELKSAGTGYYTIASAGHEDNALVADNLRSTDPCFLHYRSGAFMAARNRRGGRGEATIREVLLSLMAVAEDPVAAGRHKVWGSPQLWVPPQTSTIASHLPKAVGTAFALSRARRLDAALDLPDDAIVCCSFGDASANHATGLSGVNAARYSHRRGSPVPILFVCEDNGLGISVETPAGWIEDSFGGLAHLTYVRAGGDLGERWEAIRRAVTRCRESRSPVFLHLPVVRLWGHAGSDVERGYRSAADIEADRNRDPIARNAAWLIETGRATPGQLREILADVRAAVDRERDAVADAAPLPDRDAVLAPLAPEDPARWRAAASGAADPARRRDHFRRLPEEAGAPGRRTLAACLNAALHDEMLRRPGMLVFGEDVGPKGGVYGLTAGLHDGFGSARVFDTLLDETSILGVAQGAGLLGLLPVPEIQYLAYLHNALDQIRGEAASLSFLSDGQFTNPMVVRVASFAYQRGFGGHFHNDNSVGALRDIPGIVIAAPARGDDAARMLRGALAMAAEDGRVVLFLEPIALYHERDLHEPGDGGWLATYPPPGDALLPGEVGAYGPADADVLIVTYANGLRMSRRAARTLADEGVRTRVLDLRWLAPLPLEQVRAEAGAIGRVVVADECRASGGVAAPIAADLASAGVRDVVTVTSADSYVPLGPAADHVLLGEDDILGAVRDLLDRGTS